MFFLLQPPASVIRAGTRECDDMRPWTTTPFRAVSGRLALRAHSRFPRSAKLAACAAMALAMGASGVAVAPAARAAQNPYERGPAPTVASIEARTGPFA